MKAEYTIGVLALGWIPVALLAYEMGRQAGLKRFWLIHRAKARLQNWWRLSEQELRELKAERAEQW